MEKYNEIHVPLCAINQNTCKHTDISIVALEVIATIEITAEQCDLCGKILTQPIIEL